VLYDIQCQKLSDEQGEDTHLMTGSSDTVTSRNEARVGRSALSACGTGL